MKKHFFILMIVALNSSLPVFSEIPHSPVFLEDSDATETPENEVCDPSLGKYFTLPFFKEQPADKKCTVVKTVQKSAEEVASALGISPPQSVNEVALKFVGENGPPPNEEVKQNAYFSNLWKEVSPLIPNSDPKTTPVSFKELVLSKVPPPKTSPVPTPAPVPAPNLVENKPKGGETDNSNRPNQAAPEKTNHPMNPSPALSALDSALPNTPVPPRVPSNALGPNLTNLSSQPLNETFRRDLDSPRISPKVSFPEPIPVTAVSPISVAPNRMLLVSNPEVIKFKEPILEKMASSPLAPRSEYLDLAANSLKPQTESKKAELFSEQKIQFEEKGKPLPPMKKEQNDSVKAQNIAPSIFQSTLVIPIPQNEPSNPTPQLSVLRTKPNAEEINDKVNTPKMTSSLKVPEVSPNIGVTKPNYEASPEIKKNLRFVKLVEKIQEPVKNIFSGFLGFAKNKLARNESSQRDLSSLETLELETDVTNLVTLTPEKSSHLPWLTFFAGSVGTMCFLILFAMHSRKRRLKGTALAVVSRRIKDLN